MCFRDLNAYFCVMRYTTVRMLKNYFQKVTWNKSRQFYNFVKKIGKSGNTTPGLPFILM